MRTVIKTGLTALSLTLLATQASATELQKHPDEDKGHIQSGIIVGEITQANYSKTRITRSTTFDATVSNGKSSNTYRIDTADLFSQAEYISKIKNKSAIVSYVTHTAIGDVTMGDSYLPTFIPFFSAYSGSFGTNNLELTGLIEAKSFDQSLSVSFAGKIIQDNTVTAAEAYEISGSITSVTHQFGPSRPLVTDRSCLITVLEADGNVEIVKTLTEEMCQFAEDAALAREKVVVKYEPNEIVPELLALISLGLASVPAETTPVGHDGEDIIAHIPSQPRPTSNLLESAANSVAVGIKAAVTLTDNGFSAAGSTIASSPDTVLSAVVSTPSATASDTVAGQSDEEITDQKNAAEQKEASRNAAEKVEASRNAAEKVEASRKQEEADRNAAEKVEASRKQEEADRNAAESTEKQPHEKRKKKSKYKG